MESNRYSGEVIKLPQESGVNQQAIGIYVHIPFCEKKCFYCDFYSIENHSQREAFLNSLVREIKLFCKNLPHLYEADTVFFGGGTPSLLTPHEFDLIVNTIHHYFKVSSDIEFTMECNPGTVNGESLTGYRQLGVNRLSFGVQSFFDDELKFLSRIHDSKQAVEAFAIARESGFENINLDLMYGLPEQTMQRLLTNLRKAVELEPNHISAYNLIVEPGTPLFASVTSGRLKPLDELIEAQMYETVMDFLKSAGYGHYEISNYSRPGFQCRHNLKYWDCQEYIGFGPSAHSCLSGERWWNASSLNSYISDLSADKLPVAAKETLTEAQLVDEFIMLQLRQGKIDLNILKDKFEINIDPGFTSDLENNGYANIIMDKVFLTNKGFTVCDEITKEIGRHLHRKALLSGKISAEKSALV